MLLSVMGTAVLHPQYCLASRQSRQDRDFISASECPSAGTRSSRRASSVQYEVLSPATECARRSSLVNSNCVEGRGVLGCRNVSAGLLPLPNQVLRSTHPRAASKISSCRFGEFPTGLYYVPPTQRWFTDCSPSQGVLSHDRMLLPPGNPYAEIAANSKGDDTVGSWPSAAGVAHSHQKPKTLANSHLSNANDVVSLKWADGIQFKRRMRAELYPPVDVHKSSKPPSPDVQGGSTCIVVNIVGRKHAVDRQLKRSASEKFQEKMKVSLQRSSTKEGAGELESNLFKEGTGLRISGCRSSTVEGKHKSSTPTPSFVEEKIEEGLQWQESGDVNLQETGHKARCMSTTGVARLPHVTLSRSPRSTNRDGGVSWPQQCDGIAKASTDTKGVMEGDKFRSIPGFVVQEKHDVLKVEVTSSFDELGNMLSANNLEKSRSIIDMEGISSRDGSGLDSSRWLSMINHERWAGASFCNSPPPSSLPVPRFASKLSKVTSTCSVPTLTPDCGAEHLFPEAKRTWDVAFATKDLRRLLHLDHASCDL